MGHSLMSKMKKWSADYLLQICPEVWKFTFDEDNWFFWKQINARLIHNNSSLIDLFTVDPVWSWKNMEPSSLLLWFDWQCVALQGGRIAITWSCKHILGAISNSLGVSDKVTQKAVWGVENNQNALHLWREGRQEGRSQKRRLDLTNFALITLPQNFAWIKHCFGFG